MTFSVNEVIEHLIGLIRQAIQEIAPYQDVIELEKPREATHGDYASNIALKLAKTLRKPPRELAERILQAMPASPWVAKTEVAGAGFINFYLHAQIWPQLVSVIQQQKQEYGKNSNGKEQSILVEFVSANPTGPLHVGHGRGAAYGASLANILDANGYRVWREYYVNDAGRQMDILALSTWLRYLECCGETIDFPPNAYQGTYVREMAEAIYAQHAKQYWHDPANFMPVSLSTHTDADAHLDALISSAKKLLAVDYVYFHQFVLNEQLADCRQDLAEFGVQFDQWFSEQTLFDSGLVQHTLDILDEQGHLYSQDGAIWFRSTHFGDEKDRVVQRENGLFTYFASDIAYHLHKLERGFDRLIDVWGADHHGYIPRVKGALKAVGCDAERLTVALVQFAVLYRNGQKVAMSTRSGEFVTLRELRAEVGNDAARFFYVLRKSDQHLDFDLDLAKSQSNDNPVYYIQYAHARICSVLDQWGGDTALLLNAEVGLLSSEHEINLLKTLADYPQTVSAAARELAPHLVAYALKDVAAAFHACYNAEQFLLEDESLREARLAMILATRTVLANGLTLLGISCPTYL